MFFKNNIKYLREQKRLSQAELAQEMEVTPSTVTGWESGKSTPHFQVLLKMRDFFQIDLESLVYHDLQKEEIEGIPSTVSNVRLLELYEELKGRMDAFEAGLNR